MESALANRHVFVPGKRSHHNHTALQGSGSSSGKQPMREKAGVARSRAAVFIIWGKVASIHCLEGAQYLRAVGVSTGKGTGAEWWVAPQRVA